MRRKKRERKINKLKRRLPEKLADLGRWRLGLDRPHLFYGLEQVLLVRRVGRDAAVAAELERGHENAHGVLLVFAQAVFVVVQHLVQVQRQLWPVLSEKAAVGREKYDDMV